MQEKIAHSARNCARVVAAGFGLLAAVSAAAQTPTQLTVTDGDTLRLGDERIRLEAIDAPETFAPECLAERLLGEAATRRLAELVIGPGPVEIIRHGVDRYDRTLAVVIVAGVDVALQLVVEGLAMPWTGRQVDLVR